MLTRSVDFREAQPAAHLQPGIPYYLLQSLIGSLHAAWALHLHHKVNRVPCTRRWTEHHHLRGWPQPLVRLRHWPVLQELEQVYTGTAWSAAGEDFVLSPDRDSWQLWRPLPLHCIEESDLIGEGRSHSLLAPQSCRSASRLHSELTAGTCRGRCQVLPTPPTVVEHQGPVVSLTAATLEALPLLPAPLLSIKDYVMCISQETQQAKCTSFS